MMTLFTLTSRPSAGSAVTTAVSGAGWKNPALAGCSVLARVTACNPLGCQAMNARSGSTGGLWGEEEAESVVVGVGPGGGREVPAWFCLSRYCATITGCAGSATLMMWTHPHGHPSVCWPMSKGVV